MKKEHGVYVQSIDENFMNTKERDKKAINIQRY